MGTLAALLTMVLALIDLLTGYEISFSLFYLLPVAMSAWYAGKRVGLAACIGCALVWLLADVVSGHGYSHPAIPVWNAAVRLGFFVIVAQLLVRLRLSLLAQQTLAQRDELTGVPNRRALCERYALLAALADRNGQSLAMGFMDIDGFKATNDTLGHETGDQVLQQVAALASARLRGTDTIARLGGDEFVVLLPGADAATADAVFNDLLGALEDLARQRQWPIGFSIGVGVFAAPAPDVEAALAWVDQQMYGVKRSGGNRVAIAAFVDTHPAVAATDVRGARSASGTRRGAAVG